MKYITVLLLATAINTIECGGIGPNLLATTNIISTSVDQQLQILQVFYSIRDAITLSYHFFQYIFSGLFRIVILCLSPIAWITLQLWNNFVTKPFDLLMYIANMLYPVALFCVAAICCGLFIGGCAGFAAEALSSTLITATWGPQPKEKKPEEEELVEDIKVDGIDLPQEQEQEEGEEEELERRNLWSRNSSTFFGVNPPSSSKRRQEKEPLKKVESWRNNLDHSTTSSATSSRSTSPVLIRRMKLSSLDSDDDTRKKLHTTRKRHSHGWEWEDDEESFKNK